MIYTGIYCFTNLQNNKRYIGQSINIFDRYNQHKYRYNITNDSGYNCAFHNALRKYGWDNFSFEIIEECSVENLDEREKYWINYYNSIVPNGYNILSGGQRNRINSNRICPKCGAIKDRKSQICIACRNEEKAQNAILPLEKINIELIYNILDSSLEAQAKMIGYASGNSLKKRLQQANIPTNKDKMFQWYYEKTGEKHPKQIIKETKESNRNKQKSKRVGQYSLDGILLKEYCSTKEAQRQGYSSGHISECCRGKRKKYKGYIWKYLD